MRAFTIDVVRLVLMTTIVAMSNDAALGEEVAPGELSIVGLETAASSIRDSEGLTSLSAEQRDQLADRFVQFFQVGQAASSDEYVALMHSWGGRWRVFPDSDSMRERLINGWHPRGDVCAITMVDGEGVQCEVILGVEPNGRYAPWPAPVLAQGAMGSGALCVFDFGTESSFEAAKAGQPVAQIMIPTVELNDGSQILMGVRFLWDPQSNNWVPWMNQRIAQPGKYLCTQLF